MQAIYIYLELNYSKYLCDSYVKIPKFMMISIYYCRNSTFKKEASIQEYDINAWKSYINALYYINVL